MKTIFQLLIPVAATAVLVSCGPEDNFSTADTNDDGTLSYDEFEQALMTAIYANGDTNADGKITYAEYKTVDPNYPASRFRSRDLDGDGAVTPAELATYADKSASFDRLIKSIDTNGDKAVDRAEADAFNARLQAAKGDNALQKLYNLNASLR